jgi:hypothetical protein
MLCSPRRQHFLRGFDVTTLAALVASAEEYQQSAALLMEIDAVAWPMVYPKLADALADRCDVAWQAFQQAVYPGDDAGPAPIVLQVALGPSWGARSFGIALPMS